MPWSSDVAIAALITFASVFVACCIVVHQVRTVTLHRLRRAKSALDAENTVELAAQLDQLLLIYEDEVFFRKAT